eukprot:10770235-Lingulodinium_polyedra.AAC.2
MGCTRADGDNAYHYYDKYCGYIHDRNNKRWDGDYGGDDTVKMLGHAFCTVFPNLLTTYAPVVAQNAATAQQ